MKFGNDTEEFITPKILSDKQFKQQMRQLKIRYTRSQNTQGTS